MSQIEKLGNNIVQDNSMVPICLVENNDKNGLLLCAKSP